MPYGIRPEYREREATSYFVDSPEAAATCQPDAYEEAAELAAALGGTKLIDLGCGIGDKLVTLLPRLDTIGVDIGANLEVARQRHEGGRWIEWDLEEPGLRLSGAAGAVVTSIDVIEHMRRPEQLLSLARRLLEDGALAFVLTTPDRDLVRGTDNVGPPENVSHVREWNRKELATFLADEGLAGYVGLTRSNAGLPWFFTTIAIILSPAADAAAAEAWWRRRARYEEAIQGLQAAALEAEQVRRYARELEAQRDALLERPPAPTDMRSAARAFGVLARDAAKRRLLSGRPLD